MSKTIFTAKELEDLGFEENYVPFEESGSDDYFYYTLNFDVGNYRLCLISSSFEKDTTEARVCFFEGAGALSEEFILAIKKEFNI